MPASPLFPLPEGLEITAVSETPQEVRVHVTSYRKISCCPLCSTPSSAVHSYYRRHPLDLPCVGRPIRLLLTVKKFFCRETSCDRKIFTERLPELIEVSSRLTKRLRSSVQEIGFATCGKGGERLSAKLGIKISEVALLRSLYLFPIAPIGKVEVIGIDDWSYRHGKRYGSIIVDLQTHKIIDLLPERSVESVIAWLENHSDVEIVSRDRGSTYVDGATEGERLLRKWKLYERIHELHESGMSLRKIGEELGLARNTVRKYFRQAPESPLPTPRPLRASQLDRYEDYILMRWSQGERNAAQLHREISGRGYLGSPSTVKAYGHHLRTTTADGSPAHSRKKRAKALSPRALRWLLMRENKDLDQEEQAQLTQLLQVSSEARLIHMLLHTFLSMVRGRKYQQLRPWMQEANKSGISELKSFVAGIERDYDAVKEALRLPWSQGVTEGKVNKLKTIKRQMYGRAGFPLLRQRLLHDA